MSAGLEAAATNRASDRGTDTSTPGQMADEFEQANMPGLIRGFGLEFAFDERTAARPTVVAFAPWRGRISEHRAMRDGSGEVRRS